MVNFNQFMKQAQGIQKKMHEMQEQIANTEYYGESGGKLVHVTINGRGEMRKITIAPSLLTTEEKEVLEDLIVAAFNNAKKKADEDSQESMSSTFNGIPLPPGIKLPF